MQAFVSQLGIDWRLFLSQAVNFFLLLVILRLLVYKPLLRVLKERRVKIEEGLLKTEEAGRRLGEIDLISKERLKKAEQEALELLRRAEQNAKQTEEALLRSAKEKQEEILSSAQKVAESKREESLKNLYGESVGIVRAVLAKTVELEPKAIDEALIKKAVKEVSLSK